MKYVISITIALLVAFCALSCSTTDEEVVISDDTSETPPEEPIVLEALTLFNVSYGDHPEQVYDIYLPAGRDATKTKTIILVHGGGWTEGDKEDVNGFISLVQTTNPDHAIVNINYVLAQPPSVPAFPNQFEDLGAVIDQLNTTHQELSFKNEYGLVGVSAGAHIAMMYDYTYDTDDQVKFVANIVGPSDFTDPFYADQPNFDLYVAGLVDESAYPDTTDYATVLSPAQIVSEMASPTLLFYGNQDPLVPLTNGQRLDTGLANADVERLLTIYDGGHGNWSPASYLDVQQKITVYIETYLPID